MSLPSVHPGQAALEQVFHACQTGDKAKDTHRAWQS
jgi:hypothetical protein